MDETQVNHLVDEVKERDAMYEQALESDAPGGFDTAVHEWLSHYFPNTQQAQRARVGICGEWQDGKQKAMLDALFCYVRDIVLVRNGRGRGTTPAIVLAQAQLVYKKGGLHRRPNLFEIMEETFA